MTLAQTVTGEGFDDLSFEDIDELLVDKVLSEVERREVFLETTDSKENSDKDEYPALNADLAKGHEPASIYKLVNHFVKHDPKEEQACGNFNVI
ncbi:hypothetical protein TNCT_288951 [Trichonephila clavata]|uniref:Uncharacterized protein n=1 Tax=Trichonephila clavata TaxID=2740835 RepID=A0A8X6GXU6_TRICU|nr:hypothetical protein TNCT_288951 [Trichonephila clavata]